MHQLSFPAFAAAQQAPVPVLLVEIEDPFALQAGRVCGDMRLDFRLDDFYGFSLDAVRHVPHGSHKSTDLPHLRYVSCTTERAGEWR